MNLGFRLRNSIIDFKNNDNKLSIKIKILIIPKLLILIVLLNLLIRLFPTISNFIKHFFRQANQTALQT
jgi:hypothetical protein